MANGGGRHPYAVGGRGVYAFVGVHEVPVGVGLGSRGGGREPWDWGCEGSDEVAAEVGLGGSGGGSCPSSGRGWGYATCGGIWKVWIRYSWILVIDSSFWSTSAIFVSNLLKRTPYSSMVISKRSGSACKPKYNNYFMFTSNNYYDQVNFKTLKFTILNTAYLK